MLLLLDDQPSDLGRALLGAAERRGLDALLLSSRELADCSELSFRSGDCQPAIHLKAGGCTLETEEIDGVYCGINAFVPSLWPRFSPEDAAYASRESQALWLAILASLPCKVVNPPATDSLAGTLLSTPEFLRLAGGLGFRVPTVVDVESGERTVELLRSAPSALVADLGEEWIAETTVATGDLEALAGSRDHFRVLERMPGRPVFVTLVGRRIFPCEWRPDGPALPIAPGRVPGHVRIALRALQRRLNLELAEYSFRVAGDDWWLCGHSRPPRHGPAAFGDALLSAIVVQLGGKGR